MMLRYSDNAQQTSSQWRESIEARGKLVSPMMNLAMTVAEKHGISVKTLRGRERPTLLAEVRREFVLAARNLGKSYRQIGQFMAGRDHTTIVYYVRGRKR